MGSLYSSVIHLTNLQPTTFEFSGGQHGHAAFLDIVRQVDGALSEKLHSENARKPFTVSPLMGLPKATLHDQKTVSLRAGWECWLRITILDDGLFRSFIEHFLFGSARPEIRLGNSNFMVTEIETTPGSHPWAGYLSSEELNQRLDLPVPELWKFEFATPTQFGWKDGRIQTMPHPKQVFGNLAIAWRGMTGQDYVEPVERFVDENVIFGEYHLNTEYFTIKNKPHPGGVGKAQYINTGDPNHPLGRSLNLLAGLAFFTGLGRKTTMGMGQARCLER